ncbi:2-acylglycerol O-acyltransferase 2 isoform X2 [Nematostella vectensis]|uniref:2-acylglycerol O-acyltransferase 2 isoform X2 n=1 Tax=Nematostella vectensis TaxID=45351 RepID=UPI00207761F3|nr:2-acylglycerol O-acyltransferase 2 isoform X2 [Nematostella vectensis]
MSPNCGQSGLIQNSLEILSTALLYTTAFLGGCNIVGMVFLCLLLTPLWFVVVLYLGWVFYDWNAPERGGHQFGSDFIRQLALFRYIRDYYPISIEKTSDLDPNKNYIFGYHPHGYVAEGAVVGLISDACGFRELFPGITTHMAVHSFPIKALLHREILMSLGFVNASRESLECILTQLGPGHSAVLVVGGAAELQHVRQGTYVVPLNNRKGFIRLALETGSPLVPVVAYGQNDVLHQLGNSVGSPWWRFNGWMGDVSKKYLGFSTRFGLIHGRFLLMPYRIPIHVVVGQPINVLMTAQPSKQEIDSLHALYLNKLRELFNSHKEGTI